MSSSLLRLIPIIPAALAVLLLACSGAKPDCTPSNCAGCCTAAGVCEGGFMPQACGMGGMACTACNPTDLCQQGACMPTGGGGGGGCKPSSCVDLGKNCGSVPDGCGGTLNCGACDVAMETCGGGGVANVCAPGSCVPKSCEELGATCGMVSDGCSSILNCGTCTSPETCGGGGVANQCGQGCTPKTCAELGKNCGAVSDGCGGELSCGSCSGQQTCGGGGVANVCGQGCTPKTCGDLGANCGTLSDGCGGYLSCGSCQSPQTCGGAGTPNVCGATCNISCPTGFTCDSNGTCVGGNITNLVLNVPVPPLHTVSGKVTRNNADPVVTACGSYSYYDRAVIRFTHSTDSRFNASLTVDNCQSPSDPFTFTGQLYPGTYKVTVRKPTNYLVDSNLPDWTTEVTTSFTVSGNMSNVVFDVPVPPQHTVSGKVTRNNANPVVTACGSYSYYDRAVIGFTHTTDSRFNTSMTVDNCQSPSDPFTFSGLLYPGTYKVTVRKPTNYLVDSNLPDWTTEVTTTFTVSANMSNVVFDVPVPPQHTVSGKITRNNVDPLVTACGSYSYYDRAVIGFTHATDSRFNTSMTVDNCQSPSDPFTFSGLLYPGTYKVTVRKPTNYLVDSNLPDWTTEVTTTFTVSANMSNVVFNVPVPAVYTVSGKVTRNNVNPVVTQCGSYSYYDRAVIGFTHATDSRFNASTTVDNCTSPSDPFTFSAQLYPGTYKVTVRKPTNYRVDSNLPDWTTEVTTTFTVSGNLSNAVFDVPVPPQYTVSGVVTRNNANPLVTQCGSYSYYDRAVIGFTHSTDSRFNTSVTVDNCTSPSDPFTFSALLYPGTYKVTVRKPTNYLVDSNLPDWTTEVTTTFTVSGNQGNVAFDVPVPPQHTVSGKITRNGVNPTVMQCGSYSYYDRAVIVFTHVTDSRFNATMTVDNCQSPSDAFTFSGQLYPGTYKVTVRKPTNYLVDSDLPDWTTTVVERLQIP